jgi:hypothetical protein
MLVIYLVHLFKVAKRRLLLSKMSPKIFLMLK